MHQDHNQIIEHTDDTHVLRYLLHTVKGISPVSGGVMVDDIEQDYFVADEAI